MQYEVSAEVRDKNTQSHSQRKLSKSDEMFLTVSLRDWNKFSKDLEVGLIPPLVPRCSTEY